MRLVECMQKNVHVIDRSPTHNGVLDLKNEGANGLFQMKPATAETREFGDFDLLEELKILDLNIH